MIAVCIPSRGLMHSRTMEDVLRNTGDPSIIQDTKFIFAHGLPQPDAQNYITEEALKLKPDYIFFCDDDMAIPEGVLADMLEKNAEVVVAHYPCTRHGSDALHIRDGVFESAGMGCMLVQASVFEKLERPYFRTDVDYVWDTDQLQPYPARTDLDRHGGHDVYFSQQLVKVGILPAIIETRCGQYYTDAIRKYGNKTNLTVERWSLPA